MLVCSTSINRDSYQQIKFTKLQVDTNVNFENFESFRPWRSDSVHLSQFEQTQILKAVHHFKKNIINPFLSNIIVRAETWRATLIQHKLYIYQVRKENLAFDEMRFLTVFEKNKTYLNIYLNDELEKMYK